MSFPYIIQGKNIITVIDNVSHTINPSHISYNKILDAIKSNDWDQVKELIDSRNAVTKFADGNVTIQNDQLFWKGEILHSSLATKILAMFRDGFTIEPMVNFMINLMQNPSHRAVNELYSFLEATTLPITSDGHFLAYKNVRADYKDIYTGKFDNSIGKMVSMERNQVDDNRDQTCSKGLHFCSESYLPSYNNANGHTMIVKINPKDVVSIPSDYNNAKGRCCQYEVVGELGVANQPSPEFNKPVHDWTPEDSHHTEYPDNAYYNSGDSEGFVGDNR